MKRLLKVTVGIVLAGLAALYFWPEKSYVPYQPGPDYMAQVDNFVVPDMPPEWAWKKFKTSDGTELRWGETNNRDTAKGTLIWVPGYTANLNMYGEHVGMLQSRGWHVIGVDLRGQGGSDRHRDKFPEKMWVKDFSVYSDDLAEFIKAPDIPKQQPLILTAISFGGHVATRTLGDHPDLDVDGLYLLAPALRPASGEYSFDEAKRLMSVSRLFGKSKHYVYGQTDWRPDGLDYTQGSDCSSNPKRLYLRDAIFSRHPELRVGGVTNQWGAEFFESSDYILSEGYPEKLTLPITVISAEVDTFVVTDYNSRACSERFPDCREVTPPETGHCLPQEEDEVLEIMFDEMDTLLARIAAKDAG